VSADSAESANAVTFDDLVMTATVGVARRPLRIGALGAPAAGYAEVLGDGDPAAALLDAASLLDAGRRAGMRPVRGVAIPVPIADEEAAELSARAGRVLRHVAAFDTDTLADLLIAAAAAGYRAPAPLLPMLLDTAVRSKALRPAIGAVLGARGRWLAAQRQEWRRVPDIAAPATAAAPSADALRPGTAGEEGPSGADNTALERAAAVLRLERDGANRARLRLVVTVPESAGEDAARDGIAVRPPGAGAGSRGWLLVQIIAAAPLGYWETTFGLEAERIVSLPVDGGLRVEVHAAWRLAAIRQRNAGWALALLEAGSAPGAGGRPGGPVGGAGDRSGVPWPEDYQLAAVLPADVRAARAAGMVKAAAPFTVATGGAGAAAAAAIAEVTGYPGPWPGELAGAVLSALARTVAAAPRSRLPRELAASAARKLPVTGPRDHAAELGSCADIENCPSPWSAMLRRAAEIVALRRAFYEEIR
jgi:hypothetical protein